MNWYSMRALSAVYPFYRGVHDILDRNHSNRIHFRDDKFRFENTFHMIDCSFVRRYTLHTLKKEI